MNCKIGIWNFDVCIRKRGNHFLGRHTERCEIERKIWYRHQRQSAKSGLTTRRRFTTAYSTVVLFCHKKLQVIRSSRVACIMPTSKLLLHSPVLLETEGKRYEKLHVKSMHIIYVARKILNVHLSIFLRIKFLFRLIWCINFTYVTEISLFYHKKSLKDTKEDIENLSDNKEISIRWYATLITLFIWQIFLQIISIIFYIRDISTKSS